MQKPEAELAAELKQAEQLVVIGALYSHYKDPGQSYRVINLAVQEADETICVVYQAQYGSNLIFTRPLYSWVAQVEFNGNLVPRFTKID